MFALKAAGLSKMSFDDVVQRLKEIETSLRRSDVSGMENLARAASQRHDVAAKAQNGRGRRGKKDRSKVECYRCHQMGHYKSECESL